jgi:acyl carrier protein
MGLDFVELIMRFEEEFDILIPDADASELASQRKVVDYVMSKVPELTREQVTERVRQIIEDETGVEDFSEDDHFFYDLNID